MQKTPFVFDKENLVKAGKYPIIIAAAIGLTWVFKIYLWYFYGAAIVFLEAYAGAMYMKSVMLSDKRQSLINEGLNGAILGGAVAIVYLLLFWVAKSTQDAYWSLDGSQLLFSAVEGAFIGFLGTLAWSAYKNQK